MSGLGRKGLGVSGLGCQGLGCEGGFRVSGLGCKVLGFRASGLGRKGLIGKFRVWGECSLVLCAYTPLVWGSGLWVSGYG